MIAAALVFSRSGFDEEPRDRAARDPGITLVAPAVVHA
jgi:hypothetical protein